MPEFLLYHCPPLRAHISIDQCERNQGRRELGRHNPRHKGQPCRLQYLACLDCPGVAALSYRPGAEQPKLRSTDREEKRGCV